MGSQTVNPQMAAPVRTAIISSALVAQMAATVRAVSMKLKLMHYRPQGRGLDICKQGADFRSPCQRLFR